MSLKQRSVRCSGYIPASQYVPVYSRPQWTNHAKWHEELAPITPKPTFDDPYSNRTHSIHEAVKQWLESSPNSVIGPLDRCRSPSSGSPPSNEESIELRTPGRVDTPPWKSNNDRFYDAGSGGLSPRQISIEQSTALHSSSSVSSPRPTDLANSSPWDDTNTNRALAVFGKAATVSPVQTIGVESPDGVKLSKDDYDDGKSTRANDAVPSSTAQESCSSSQVFSHEEEASGLAEEGTSDPSPTRRGGKKRPITELNSSDRECSFGSLSDINSRAVSREFDTALAFVVKDIKNHSPNDTALSYASGSSSVGAPTVLLKPPRGLEKHVPHDPEQDLALALLRVSSAREPQNPAIKKLTPPVSRAASTREDNHSASMRLPPFFWAAGTTEESSRVAVGPKAKTTGTTEESSRAVVGANAKATAEIVPEIVEKGVGDKENISKGRQIPLLANAIEKTDVGHTVSLKKTVESHLEVDSRKETSAVPRQTLRAVMLNEKNAAVRQSQTRSSDSPAATSNNGARVSGASDFRHERSSGRARSSYSSGASVANTPNNVPQQCIYKVSPTHQSVRKANHSRKQNAVVPVEADQQVRGAKCTRSNRSTTKSIKATEREVSPSRVALHEAKLGKLRMKADAWENLKNASIVNRYEREERKIDAWEEKVVAKATVALSKVETEMEKKRGKATERMQFEVAQAHERATEMKAHAEAKRAERAAKAAIQAQILRVFGKSPLSCFCRSPVRSL